MTGRIMLRRSATWTVLLVCGVAGAGEWRHPLCLDGGGYWRQRVRVDVANKTDKQLAGDSADVRIGNGHGEAALAGMAAEAVRVCDASGSEMLFDIRGPDGRPVRRGVIPAGSVLTLPVECAAGSSAAYEIYFDNSCAWAVPEFLETRGDAAAISANAGPVERIDLRETGGGADWPAGEDLLPYRAAVRVMNFRDTSGQTLVHVALRALEARIRGEAAGSEICVMDGARVIPHYRLAGEVVFPAELPARSVRTFYAYVSLKAPPGSVDALESLMNSNCNLVRNGGFEQGDAAPADWTPNATGKRKDGPSLTVDSPGRFGRRCARTHIPAGVKPSWTGWNQTVEVKPGRRYLYAAWVKCEDARGSVQLHGHIRNASGNICSAGGYTSVGQEISGTTDWTLMSGLVRTPPDAAAFQLHLTTNVPGTVWHDAVLLAEVAALEGRMTSPEELAVWPVNPVVKVFREDVPPRDIPPARISCARNECEPLQLVVRSHRAIRDVRVEVDAPTNPAGKRLDDVEVGVVGYVPIDHPTAYYRSDSPAWHRKFPTASGGCDGWAGLWPDPLLPTDRFDLAADASQPVWLTVSVPRDAQPGDHAGKVRLVAAGRTLREVPFAVRVRDFALPDESHVKAIYDARFRTNWEPVGKTPAQLRREIWAFLAKRRLSPHEVWPAPKIQYRGGKVVVDFAEFDEAAAYYFDVLKLPHAYTPSAFYLFGWGHPPAKKFGQEPYDGAYPYEGADRSRLNPKYTEAYQACLKVFWEHIRQKGWEKKFTLYISDEPHFRQAGIVPQMKALCEMIRQADTSIPIYSSTWSHVPEWDGSLTVWGLGHYGRVPPEKLADLIAGGA